MRKWGIHLFVYLPIHTPAFLLSRFFAFRLFCFPALLACILIILPAQGDASGMVLSLKDAIQRALKNNETVLQAEQTLALAEAELRIAEADQYPQVQLKGNYNQLGQETEKSKDYVYRLELSQLVGRFGAVPDYLDQVQEKVRFARLDLEQTRQNVVFLVRQVFQNIWLTQEEIKERRELEEELLKKLERTQRRRGEGLLIKIHVLSAELELREQQLELNRLERRLDVDQAELSRLTGLDPMEPVQIVEEVSEMNLTLETCIQLALEHHTELRDLSGQVERQTRLVREIRWKHLPELTAFYRYKDVGVDLIQRDNTWDLLAKYDPAFLEKDNPIRSSERKGWEIGFNLRFPLLEGSRTERWRDREEAERNRLRYVLQALKKQITVEIRRKYRAVASAKERVELEQKRVAVHAERLRVIESILESGQRTRQYQSLTFDDVITVRQDYTDAQRSYYQARRDYAQTKEELRKAMGLTQ